MTRAERHIAVLSRLLENMDVYNSIQPTTERKKAIKAAIQALSQEPCDDTVSREDAIESIANIDETDGTVAIFTGKQVIALLNDLPPVTQKYGKWIDRQFQSKIDGKIRNGWECSECGERFFRYDLVNTDEFIPKYCPNCGAKMVEPQESEE